MKKQTFHISGMTCSGCEQSVVDALKQLKSVTKAEANHKNGTLLIWSDTTLSADTLLAALPKKYALLDDAMLPPSKVKQLYPLFLIFGFIIGTLLLIHIEHLDRTAMMHDFMGMFFIVFSFFKFLDLRGFQASFKKYDPLAAALPFYGWIYPFIEVFLGICYIRDIVPSLLLIATIAILGVTTIGVVKSLLQKQNIQCACLGSVLNLPMTEATFIENAIMLVMAGSLLA